MSQKKATIVIQHQLADMIVTEVIDGFLHDEDLAEIPREEDLLLQSPDPKPMNIWRQQAPIGVVRFPMTHVPGPFSPPTGVFESDFIHIEWTRMNSRQPFYHRNQDCDEIALHIDGKRSVLTEIGTVDLEVGDFSMIPIGVCHDNRGINDVHMIFYITAPVTERKAPSRTSEYRVKPYEEWEPAESIEFVSERLGALGTDTSTFLTKEQLLIDQAKNDKRRLHILRADHETGTEWLYKAEHIWIGVCKAKSSRGETYSRHRFADEVQLQLRGKRTLITQRGTVDIEPGEFLSIPKGCAFTSISNEGYEYVVVLMRYPAEAMKPFVKETEKIDFKKIAGLRETLVV